MVSAHLSRNSSSRYLHYDPVLDSTLGRPAANVNVRLEAMEGSNFVTLASGYVQLLS